MWFGLRCTAWMASLLLVGLLTSNAAAAVSCGCTPTPDCTDLRCAFFLVRLSIPLSRLVGTNVVNVDANVIIDVPGDVVLPNIRKIIGSMTTAGNVGTTSLSFPALTSVGWMEIDSEPALRTLNFPVLAEIPDHKAVAFVVFWNLLIHDLPALEAINFPAYAKGIDGIAISNVNAATVSFSSLFWVGKFSIQNLRLMHTLTLPKLSGSDFFEISGTPSLTTIDTGNQARRSFYTSSLALSGMPAFCEACSLCVFNPLIVAAFSINPSSLSWSAMQTACAAGGTACRVCPYSPTPTNTPTPSFSSTPSNTPSMTPTPTPSQSMLPPLVDGESRSNSPTASTTASATPSTTSSATATSSPSSSSSPSFSPTAFPTPSAAPSPVVFFNESTTLPKTVEVPPNVTVVLGSNVVVTVVGSLTTGGGDIVFMPGSSWNVTGDIVLTPGTVLVVDAGTPSTGTFIPLFTGNVTDLGAELQVASSGTRDCERLDSQLTNQGGSYGVLFTLDSSGCDAQDSSDSKFQWWMVVVPVLVVCGVCTLLAIVAVGVLYRTRAFSRIFRSYDAADLELRKEMSN